MARDEVSQEIIALTQRLLDAIVSADWETYAELCDPTLTCFEPEAAGHLVEGLEFHRYYFDLGPARTPVNVTMVSPHVRVMGDVAIVSYVRLAQKISAAGAPETSVSDETRVWQRQGDVWRHVHFHRSRPDE